jgi:hypothetical protein
MAKKDAVIGFITNYNFDKLKPWAHSLIDSGFTGDKIIVAYEPFGEDVIPELHELGINTIALKSEGPFSIMVHRFFHLWWMLNSIEDKYRYVITTDVADVVFQSNPSDFLDNIKNDKSRIIASSEGICYKDEPWGDQNLRLSFGPYIHNLLKEDVICNAGVIAGEHKYVESLALNIFLSCQGSPLHVPGGGGPDQAALNTILKMSPWDDITWRTNHDDGWACQAGTVADPAKMDKFGPKLVDNQPSWDGENVMTPDGKKYVIVHQYNRIPEWKEVIEKRYDR